jgi:hypothetical protein
VAFLHAIDKWIYVWYDDQNTWIDTLYGPPMVPIASLRGTYQLNGNILELTTSNGYIGMKPAVPGTTPYTISGYTGNSFAMSGGGVTLYLTRA